MGSYLKQVSASKGLLDEARFGEMFGAIQDEAGDPRWDDYGTVGKVRESYDFRGICRAM